MQRISPHHLDACFSLIRPRRSLLIHKHNDQNQTARADYYPTNPVKSRPLIPSYISDVVLCIVAYCPADFRVGRPRIVAIGMGEADIDNQCRKPSCCCPLLTR